MGKMREIATEGKIKQCYYCPTLTEKFIMVHVYEDAKTEFPPLVPICKACAGNYQHTADAWMDKHGEDKCVFCGTRLHDDTHYCPKCKDYDGYNYNKKEEKQ